MDEVERAQTRLLSLQREKVKSNILCLEMIQLASQFILVLFLCSCFLFIFFLGGEFIVQYQFYVVVNSCIHCDIIV